MAFLTKWHEDGRHKIPGTLRFQAKSSRYESPKIEETNPALHIKKF